MMLPGERSHPENKPMHNFDMSYQRADHLTEKKKQSNCYHIKLNLSYGRWKARGGRCGVQSLTKVVGSLNLRFWSDSEEIRAKPRSYQMKMFFRWERMIEG